MSAPGSTSALRPDTFNNLQLNAGIVIKDLVYTGTGAPASSTELATLIAGIVGGTVSGKGDLLGATRGGGSFNVTRETRTPDIDGMRYPFKKSDFVDSIDAYLSTTLVEITPENVAVLLATGDAVTTGNTTKVTMRTAIDDEDYLDNLCWVGDLADGRLALICLKNAINTADFTFTYTDKGEGTLAAEFHARQASVSDYDNAPFEVIFFGPAT